MVEVFTTVHHVKKFINNSALQDEHLFINYSPSIHLFTFRLFFSQKVNGQGEQ